MLVVVDGLSVRQGSNAIVLEHLFKAWRNVAPEDEIHLVLGEDAKLAVPVEVHRHVVDLGRRRGVGRILAQERVIPKLCRELRADVMLGAVPSTTIRPICCPRAVIAWDVRYALRPEQFGWRTRLARRVSYAIGFHETDAVACISRRTRDDVRRLYPALRDRPVVATVLGGDHAADWGVGTPPSGRALAFGQWGNKNVDLVLQAWGELLVRGRAIGLDIVGLDSTTRALLEDRISELGLGHLVQPRPWLTDAEFADIFGCAALVVFPSDFEGFGLPAVEAMRLGIPLVVSGDPALLEVTAGLAAVATPLTASALADAIVAACDMTSEELGKAREHATDYTWTRTAELMRGLLLQAISSRTR